MMSAGKEVTSAPLWQRCVGCVGIPTPTPAHTLTWTRPNHFRPARNYVLYSFCWNTMRLPISTSYTASCCCHGNPDVMVMAAVRNLPGVVKRVPFSRAGIATVSCVVAAHSGAWVVGHCIQVVHGIYCSRTEEEKKTECRNFFSQSIWPDAREFDLKCWILREKKVSAFKWCDPASQLTSRQATFLQYYRDLVIQHVKYTMIMVMTNRKWISEAALTAVFRSELPQVEILHGEVDEGGQFAGSSCLREALQVWTGRRVKEHLLCVFMPIHSANFNVSYRVDSFTHIRFV